VESPWLFRNEEASLIADVFKPINAFPRMVPRDGNVDHRPGDGSIGSMFFARRQAYSITGSVITQAPSSPHPTSARRHDYFSALPRRDRYD
jgi:hypothetical protein